MMRLKETEKKIQASQKERVIKIPVSAFERKRSTKSILTTSVLNSISVENPVRAAGSRKRNTKEEPPHFTITYKDSLVPDEIYYSETFQKVKRESVLQNMNQAVHKFFKNREDAQNRELVCRWLSSLEGLFSFPYALMQHLMWYMSLERHEDKYGRRE